jgi:uncharacterized protein involved in outer membrane biogenesis
MRLKVPFVRYALAGFAFLLPTAVLAAILPFLVNAQPVRAKLLREIGSWTGAEVKVAGAISIKDFFSLSVEAQNVEIGQFKDFAPIEGMKAASVVARIDWSDLLLGNLQFDKISIHNAVFKVRSEGVADIPAFYQDLISGEPNKSFAAFNLDDSIIAVRPSGRTAYRRLVVDNATVRSARSGRQLLASARLRWKGMPFSLTVNSDFHTQREARVPLRVRLASDLIRGRFDGNTLLSGGAAEAAGEFAASGPDLAKAADWLGVYSPPGMFGVAFDVSGPISVSPQTAALTTRAISLAGQTAEAALTLDLKQTPPHLEGTLAFNQLDLKALLSETGLDRLASRAQSMPLLETDLRVSAKGMVWNGMAAGETALTLASHSQRMTAEIAELDFLGGEVRGQIAMDMSGPQTRASARLSIEGLDAAGFLNLMQQRDWLSGAADVNLEAEATWTDPAEIKDRLIARARVNFPEGGQMRLDIPRLASTSPGETDGWGTFEFTNAAFEKLRFEMTLRNGQLSFTDVLLASAGRHVSGHGEIDLATRSLDWRFSFTPRGGPANGSLVKGDATSSVTTSGLSIKGPWIRPVIRSGDAPDSSMLGRASTHYGRS